MITPVAHNGDHYGHVANDGHLVRPRAALWPSLALWARLLIAAEQNIWPALLARPSGTFCFAQEVSSNLVH